MTEKEPIRRDDARVFVDAASAVGPYTPAWLGRERVTASMKACTACDSRNVSVIDSRATESVWGPTVRRRRLCHDCGHRFTSVEVDTDLFATLEDDYFLAKLPPERRATLRQIARVLWPQAEAPAPPKQPARSES